MQEIFKKFIDFGLETQSRVAEFMTDVFNKARMDQVEREQFVADLESRLQQNREKGEKLIKEMMDKVPTPGTFAKQKELEELRKRVEELEVRLKVLEQMSGGGTPSV